MEHRARRRDILVDDETLFDFYDQRVPEHAVSGAHFDSWWKHKRHEAARLPRLRARDAHQREGGGGHQGRLSGLLAAGAAEVPGDVPVRAEARTPTA
ncbi:DUF3418 domain-containing protein [Streptomyces thinghirensis]|nr:DUF3418 domain-containing protein [Streptomyces thinghirensis]